MATLLKCRVAQDGARCLFAHFSFVRSFICFTCILFASSSFARAAQWRVKGNTNYRAKGSDCRCQLSAIATQQNFAIFVVFAYTLYIYIHTYKCLICIAALACFHIGGSFESCQLRSHISLRPWTSVSARLRFRAVRAACASVFGCGFICMRRIVVALLIWLVTVSMLAAVTLVMMALLLRCRVCWWLFLL